jgi:hypothetical protein
MDNNGENQMQITAPVKLCSDILIHPSKPILYFSLEKSNEATTEIDDQIVTQAYEVIYSIQ